MKRTILILLAILTLTPAALCAQESGSLYNGWGLGFQVGAGGMVPTGSLGDDLKGCALFTGGLNAEYNNLRLKADVSFSQPSFKNVNPYSIFDSEGRDLQLNATANPTMLGLGVQLGYTVLRQGRLSITPLVGFNWNRLSWDINHIKYENDDEGKERPSIEDVTSSHENSFGWTASVDFDIKLNGKFVNEGGTHYTSSLRITPFISHAGYSNLSPSVKGNWLGVTVSYAGLFRLIK